MNDNEPIVSKEERDFIRTSGITRDAIGYLIDIRGGMTLEEAHKDAMTDPFQTEHRTRYEKIYKFLDANRARFNIPPKED